MTPGELFDAVLAQHPGADSVTCRVVGGVAKVSARYGEMCMGASESLYALDRTRVSPAFLAEYLLPKEIDT